MAKPGAQSRGPKRMQPGDIWLVESSMEHPVQHRVAGIGIWGPSASDSGNGSGLTNIFSPVLAEILGENRLLHQLRVPCGLEPSIVQLDGCVLHFCSALGSLPITPVLSSAASSPPFNLTSPDSTGIPGTIPQPTRIAPQDATGKPVTRSQSLPPLSIHAEPQY